MQKNIEIRKCIDILANDIKIYTTDQCTFEEMLWSLLIEKSCQRHCHLANKC